jgi:hypothetical protein
MRKAVAPYAMGASKVVKCGLGDWWWGQVLDRRLALRVDLVEVTHGADALLDSPEATR